MASTEAGIDSVYDVTEIVKSILVMTNDGQEGHPLIEYDSTQKDENILFDFRRSAVRVVNNTEYSSKFFPKELSNDMAPIAEKAMLEVYLSEFAHMGIENFRSYNSQAFSSIATTRVLSPVLGNDPGLYNPSFSNGKVCHFWKETIKGVDHLHILSIDDGFNIQINVDEETRHIPGAMVIELTVPFTTIQAKEPITEHHITKAVVTSEEFNKLLTVGSDEERKEVISKASLNPVESFGEKIRQASFIDNLQHAHLIENYTEEDLDKETNDGNSSSSDTDAAAISDSFPSPSHSDEEKEGLEKADVEKAEKIKILSLLANLNRDLHIPAGSSKNIRTLANEYLKRYRNGEVKNSPGKFLNILLEAAMKNKPETQASLFNSFASFFSGPAEEKLCSAKQQLYEHIGAFLANGNQAEDLIGFLQKNQMSNSAPELGKIFQS